MRLNIRQLAAFKAVMERGTVSGAARALNVSQPAITKSIRLLEAQLELRLFVRSEGKLVPSLEAKALIGPISKIFDDIEVVAATAKHLLVGDADRFQVAATFGHAHAFLPDAIGNFSSSHPTVDLRLLTLRPDQILELVGNHEVDLGLVYQPVDHRFREILLCDTDVVCVMRSDHPLASREIVSAAELGRDKVISYVEQSHTGELIKQNCLKTGMPWNVSIRVNQTSTAIGMVEAGLGVAVVDCLWIKDTYPDGITVRPFTPKTTLTSRLIYAIDRPFSRTYKEFSLAVSRSVRSRLKRYPALFRPPSKISKP